LPRPSDALDARLLGEEEQLLWCDTFRIP